MSPSKTSNALCERSPNTSSPSPGKSQSPEKATKTHQGGINLNEKPIPRFELNTNTTIGHNQTTATYISPSDAIRSPATKKLSEIKGKRFQYVFPSVLYLINLSIPSHILVLAVLFSDKHFQTNHLSKNKGTQNRRISSPRRWPCKVLRKHRHTVVVTGSGKLLKNNVYSKLKKMYKLGGKKTRDWNCTGTGKGSVLQQGSRVLRLGIRSDRFGFAAIVLL